MVAHDECCVKKGYDWADPNGNGRPCCHVCSGNLNERRKARDRAFDRARKEFRRDMANDILTGAAAERECVGPEIRTSRAFQRRSYGRDAGSTPAGATKTWLSKRRFQEYKAGVVWVQAIARGLLCRKHFRAARSAAKRLISCNVEAVSVSSVEPLPDHASLFGILTVLDHTQRVVLRARRADSDEPRRRRGRFLEIPRETAAARG